MKINKSTYQGYLWYSDRTEPEVIDGEFELDSADCSNPFIVEGQLYDTENDESISIKHLGGLTLVQRFRLSDYPEDNAEEMSFLPNRMNGVSSLKFTRFWTTVPDDNCEGMPVLKPTALIFTGFKK